jgi:hypothetical protein
MKKLANVERNFESLKYLASCQPKVRRSILQNANNNLIHAICECMLNFLRGNISTADDVVKKAKRYKKTLRQLMNKDDTLEHKKEILVQKGGFLPVILPTILGILSSFLGK